jgi:hypothetical protein
MSAFANASIPGSEIALECQRLLKTHLVKITQRFLLGLPERADAKGLAPSRIGKEHRTHPSRLSR